MGKKFWSKRLVVSAAMIGLALGAMAQVHKEFTVESLDSCDELDINLKAVASTTFIHPTSNLNPVNIFGTSMNGEFDPQFTSYTQGKTRFVQVQFEESALNGIGRSLSHKVRNDTNDEENQWQVYLSNAVPLRLSLNYMMGDAQVDLSGLPIEKLAIKIGSAEVSVGYEKMLQNPIKVDTFLVNVDVGSLTVDHLDLMRAEHVIADVGIGSLELDYSGGQPMKSHVSLSVGAGDLTVHLPSSKLPVLIKLDNTLLCRVNMDGNFRKIRDGVYVNEAYSASAPNIVVFNVSVAMGSLSFEEK